MRNPFLKTNCFAEYDHIKSYLVWGDVYAVAKPKVSVIMPVFRGGDYFRLAIESVLNQDYNQPYEVIVVDNNPMREGTNSNQELIEALNDNRILYYRHDENIGMFPNWNRGIELARSEFITYCHEDDLLTHNALSILMGVQSNTGNKAIFTFYNMIDKKGNFIWKEKTSLDTKFSLIKRKYYASFNLYDCFLRDESYSIGCLYNRDSLLALGGFDQSAYPSGDWALNVAYTHFYGAVKCIMPTFSYRYSDNESFAIWPKFGNCQREIFSFAKVFLPIPNFILDFFVEAKAKEIDYNAAITWGNISVNKAPSKGRIHQFFLNFLRMCRKPHFYKLSI